MKGIAVMTTEVNNSNKKFEEALHLLNEAAKDKKEELQRLFSEKYSHISDALQEVASKNRATLNRYKRISEDTIREGSEKIREVASEVDEQVHQNPWPYIGGAALGALLLGFILSASRKD